MARRKEMASGKLYLGTKRFTYLTTKSTIMALGRGWSPIRVKMTCFTLVLKTIFSSVCKIRHNYNCGCTAIIQWCSSSLRGKVVDVDYHIPARNIPNRAIGYCNRFGIINATRSLFKTKSICGRRQATSLQVSDKSSLLPY